MNIEQSKTPEVTQEVSQEVIPGVSQEILGKIGGVRGMLASLFVVANVLYPTTADAIGIQVGNTMTCHPGGHCPKEASHEVACISMKHEESGHAFMSKEMTPEGIDSSGICNHSEGYVISPDVLYNDNKNKKMPVYRPTPSETVDPNDTNYGPYGPILF